MFRCVVLTALLLLPLMGAVQVGRDDSTILAPQTDSIACKPGRTRIGNLCVACSPGKYNPNGKGKCKLCPRGSSSLAGKAKCESCGPGTYNDKLGAIKCTECPAGSENRFKGSVTKIACTLCVAGTASAAGRERCEPCSSGKYSSKGAASCTKCPYGTASVFNKSMTPSRGPSRCSKCPRGKYATEEGSVSCERCWPGSANDKLGARYCSRCVPGKFAAKYGQSKCTPCPGGSSSPFFQAMSAAICIPCPKGTETGYDHCIPCAPGSFANLVGTTRCQKCPPGSVASNRFSTSCSACPAGTFSNGTGGVTCSPCGVNTFSPASGASICVGCLPGFDTAGKTGSKECRLTPLHVNTTKWLNEYVRKANTDLNPPKSCNLCNGKRDFRIGACVMMDGGKGRLFSVHEVNHREPTRLLGLLKRDDNQALVAMPMREVQFCPATADNQISFEFTFEGVSNELFKQAAFERVLSAYFHGVSPNDVETHLCGTNSTKRASLPLEYPVDFTTIDNPEAVMSDKFPEETSSSTTGGTGITGATGGESAKSCPKDVKKCLDTGLYVRRNPKDGCKFFPCLPQTNFMIGPTGTSNTTDKSGKHGVTEITGATGSSSATGATGSSTGATGSSSATGLTGAAQKYEVDNEILLIKSLTQEVNERVDDLAVVKATNGDRDHALLHDIQTAMARVKRAKELLQQQLYLANQSPFMKVEGNKPVLTRPLARAIQTAIVYPSPTDLRPFEGDDNMHHIKECSTRPVLEWCKTARGLQKCGLSAQDCRKAQELSMTILPVAHVPVSATGAGLIGPASVVSMTGSAHSSSGSQRGSSTTTGPIAATGSGVAFGSSTGSPSMTSSGDSHDAAGSGTASDPSTESSSNSAVGHAASGSSTGSQFMTGSSESHGATGSPAASGSSTKTTSISGSGDAHDATGIGAASGPSTDMTGTDDSDDATGSVAASGSSTKTTSTSGHNGFHDATDNGAATDSSTETATMTGSDGSQDTTGSISASGSSSGSDDGAMGSGTASGSKESLPDASMTGSVDSMTGSVDSNDATGSGAASGKATKSSSDASMPVDNFVLPAVVPHIDEEHVDLVLPAPVPHISTEHIRKDTVLPAPVPHISTEHVKKDTVLPAPVPHVGQIEPAPADVSLMELEAKPSAVAQCSKITLHHLNGKTIIKNKDIVRKLKINYAANLQLVQMLNFYDVHVPYLAVSECKFCNLESRGLRVVKLPSPRRTTTNVQMQNVTRKIKPIIVPVNRSTTTPVFVVKTTTAAPVIQKKKHWNKIPIHVNDCVWANTADVAILREDHSVGKVIEVFRSDLLSGKPIWLRVHFSGMKYPIPFSFNEVKKVPCVQHGLSLDLVSVTGGASELPVSSSAESIRALEATGATGSSDATSSTGSSDATSSTGNDDVVDGATKIMGSTISKPSLMPDHSKEMKDDEFVLSIKLPTQDMGTAHTIITAQEAVAKSEEKLLHGRVEREAFSSAVAFLRAARHRDAVFARAVKTGTHIIGFTKVLEQVNKLGQSALSARKSYAALLKLTGSNSVLKERMRKLDDNARFVLDRSHPIGTVSFNEEDCRRSKKLFDICPTSFGCQHDGKKCLPCSSCDIAKVAVF